jgi:hypothetical protein
VSSASFALPGLDFQAGDLEGENLLGVNGVIAGRNTWIAQGSVSNTRWWPTIGVGAKAASLGSLRQAGGGPFVILPHYGTALGWIARDTHEFDDAQNDPHEFDSGPTLGFLDTKQMGVHPYDSSWGASISATASFFRKAFGGDRDLDEYFTAFETSYAVSQDVIVWARAVYEKKVGGPLLASESLLLRDAVRGARGLEGTDRGAATLEVRFPIWRNLFWMPIEVLGLGEYLLLKDLRGFVFGDAGFAGTEFLDIHMRRFGAISGGVGLRLDFFWMLFPVANARVATRVEVWYAVVGEQGDAPRGALGFALTLGY